MTNESRRRVRVLLVVQLAGRSALRNDAGGESFHTTKCLDESHSTFSHHGTQRLATWGVTALEFARQTAREPLFDAMCYRWRRGRGR